MPKSPTGCCHRLQGAYSWVMTNTAYIVASSAACMPGSCWGVYRRVAVLEVERGEDGEPVSPRMISERARGVVRLVETWEALNVGKVHRRGGKGRCAYSRAMVEAEELAAKLNAA